MVRKEFVTWTIKDSFLKDSCYRSCCYKAQPLEDISLEVLAPSSIHLLPCSRKAELLYWAIIWWAQWHIHKILAVKRQDQAETQNP